MSSARQMGETQLLADLANHKMTVLADSGLYRHLKFRQPDNSNMWFEIVTWPGSLTIHGDMGTWAFSRVEDMFKFFRSSTLKINASYWGEKITSESRYGGPHKKFNADTYRANVLSGLEGYGLSEQRRGEISKELEEILGDECEVDARRAVAEFESGDFQFSDPWEIEGRGYTHHYLWCLYAIVWAIQRYDAALAITEVA